MSKTQVVNVVVLLGLFASATTGLDISTIFTTCKVHDPNLNECLKGAIQSALVRMANGVEELNSPVLEPIYIKEVKIPPGAGKVHVEQVFKDMRMYNVALGSKILSVEADIKSDSFVIDLDVFSPEYRIEADYTLDGKVLLLPVVGSGKCVIKLDDVESKIHLVGGTITKDDKVFGHIKTMDLEFLPKKVEFKFDNLFNGDPVLGRELNALLNDKWEDVFHDVKANYAKFVADKLVTTANEVFHHVEFNSLFHD